MFELLLLHPKLNSETSSSNPSTLVPIMLFRLSSFFLRVVIRVPNSPRPGSNSPIRGALYPVGGGVETAEMVKVEDAALDPGEMVEGLKAQFNPAGAEQVSVI